MFRYVPCLSLLAALVPLSAQLAAAGEGDGRLDIYWTDVEGGAATLIVTPAGESILIDAGLPGERDPGRIHETITQKAGLKRLDHLVVTHFDRDHYGGVADLTKKIAVTRVYDHGLPKKNSALMARLKDYVQATEGKRQALRPGDTIPLKAKKDGSSSPLLLRCLVAHQKFVAATRSQAEKNPNCRSHVPKEKDNSNNANSIVLLLSFGDFRFFDGADLTWNLEHRLVCPTDLVGPVDVFQIDHHGLANSNNPVLIHTLKPRVVIMNNGPLKGCDRPVFKTVKETPSVEAIYQLHRNVRTGPENNTVRRRIANVDEKCQANLVQLSVDPTGKSYDVLIPADRLKETFKTRAP